MSDHPTIRLPVVVVSRRNVIKLWICVAFGPLTAGYAITRSPPAVPSAVALLILFSTVGVLGIRIARRLGLPAFLQVDDAQLVLVCPGLLGEPFAIPRSAIASVTVQIGRGQRAVPSRPESPPPSLTSQPGQEVST